MDSREELLPGIDRYLDDEIGRDERMEFERQLADSPELSGALAERRAAMEMLADWSGSLVEQRPRRRLSAGQSLRLALAAAAAAAMLVLPLRMLGGGAVARPGQDGAQLAWRDMSDGVRVIPGAEAGAVELVVDPFPMQWRTLSDGVQVIRSESGGPDELLVDPFPEEEK